MRNTLIGILLVSFTINVAFSQEISKPEGKYSGLWLGVMQVTDQMSMQLAFEIIIEEEESYSAKMNVIEQKALDIPMDECIIRNDSVHIVFNAAGITYEGKYDWNVDTIYGTYTQSGNSFPLNLSKVDKLPLEVNRPQTPKRPFPYTEENVTFDNEKADITLAGTLTMPSNSTGLPGVILIAGSGRTDRNETGMGHFLLLSDFLTRNGYAVLRYDKRGVGESGGDYIQSTTYDFVEDVLSALTYLERRPEIDHKKISLIGHSEGALIAPMVAADNPGIISSIILMGGIGVTGAELLLIQAEKIARINGVSEDDINAIVSKNNAYYSTVLEGGSDSVITNKLKNADPEINDGALQMLLLPWFRTFLSIDPGIYLQRVRCPVLAITGELDSQCPPAENLAGIERALKDGGNTNYEIKSLPGLNHLFQTAKSGSPYEYDQLEEIISPATLDLILEWLKRQE